MKSGKNMLMDMRKNCNHPDLIESEVIADLDYPPPEKMIEECGKLALLDRLLTKLHQKGHKVLIFSQVCDRGNHWLTRINQPLTDRQPPQGLCVLALQLSNSDCLHWMHRSAVCLC